MFVIKNKLSLSYRRVKSMHYPESPKVSVYEEHPLAGRDIQYQAPDSRSRRYKQKDQSNFHFRNSNPNIKFYI